MIVEPKQRKRNTKNKLSEANFRKRLDAHAGWLKSNGGRGARADFSCMDLFGYDFSGHDLQKADFSFANFEGGSLSDAIFREADLRGVRFGECSVEGVNFTQSDLRDADLSKVSGLKSEQLMRSNLSGAKLPDPVKSFDSVSHLSETAKIARPLFFLNLALCMYALAASSSTTDAALLTNAPSSILPNISTPIPTKGFYYFMPLMLFSVHVYFHIHIEQILQDMMRLPSVFPDGTPITRKIYPWVILRLLARNIDDRAKIFTNDISAQRVMVNFTSASIAWWLTPLVLVFIWLNFLPSHDWYGALWIILLTTGAISTGELGIQSLSLSRAHPGFVSADLAAWRRQVRRGNMVRYAVTGSVAILMIAITYGAFHGARASGAGALSPRTWVPASLNLLGMSAFADISNIDVSQRAQGALQKGADLAGRDLASVDATGAYIEGAGLQDANLSGASLERSNLRHAAMMRANLTNVVAREADFTGANLRDAVMDRAALSGAILDSATLSGAGLYDANVFAASMKCTRAHSTNLQFSDLRSAFAPLARFNEAKLSHANLTGANFWSANFELADLSSADLHRASFDNAQFGNAILSAARITAASFRNADFTGADLSNVQTAKATQPPSFRPDFSGADLEFSIGLTQSVLDHSCGDAETRLPEGLFIPRCDRGPPPQFEASCQ